VPLFAEEITKAAMEAQNEGSVARVVSATATAANAIPATLHASLMSRLDRLGTAKEVAQIGAAIGRDFPHELLTLVAEKREDELSTALHQLVDAGLLFQDGRPPTAKYLFKHALVQDAAYGTLLRETRRTVHLRIAHALESRFPDTVARQPELLARHFTEAGEIEKAAPLWGRAGLKSVGQSALLEAKDQLTRALAQIATLPTTRELRRLEIELQVALISPLFHLSGYASTETRAAVERAQLLVERANSLGEQSGDPLLLVVVLNGLWAANVAAFNGGALLEIADQLMTLADQQPSAATRMVAHRSMGVSLLCTGKPETAKQHLDRAIQLYVSSEHRVLAMRLGQDVGTLVLAWRSLAQWILGYPDSARADVEQALENARSIGHAGTTMYAQSLGGLTNMLLGNYGVSDKLLKEVAQLAAAKGALFWQAAATLLRACVLVLTDQQTSDRQLLAAVIARPRSTESSFLSPYFLTYLAMSHTSTGETKTATRTLDQALAALNESKECWFEPEVHRMIGEVGLGSPISDTSVAEAEFAVALRIAREHRAKSWELRAATSLARLWRHQGKQTAAHDLLAPVYAWFTEGFDTLDLKQAKALLDELR
jgi:predicted ATPase